MILKFSSHKKGQFSVVNQLAANWNWKGNRVHEIFLCLIHFRPWRQIMKIISAGLYSNFHWVLSQGSVNNREAKFIMGLKINNVPMKKLMSVSRQPVCVCMKIKREYRSCLIREVISSGCNTHRSTNIYPQLLHPRGDPWHQHFNQACLAALQ